MEAPVAIDAGVEIRRLRGLLGEFVERATALPLDSAQEIVHLRNYAEDVKAKLHRGPQLPPDDSDRIVRALMRAGGRRVH